VEDGGLAPLAAASGAVFAAVLCAATSATLVLDAIWGDAVHLSALYRRFLSLSPFLLAIAVAITAALAAARWRSRSHRLSEQSDALGDEWINLPEAPFLRLKAADVGVIRTARNYCELDVAGRPFLVRITAKRLEERLAPHGFVRVHRGLIVNLARVRVVEPVRSGRLRVLLDDDSEISVSRGHREPFSRLLSETVRTQFSHDRAA